MESIIKDYTIYKWVEYLVPTVLIITSKMANIEPCALLEGV
jgi:hypothetical protein